MRLGILWHSHGGGEVCGRAGVGGRAGLEYKPPEA